MKRAFVMIVLLWIGIMVGRNLYQSKYSLSYDSDQIPSDKIDTSIRLLQLTDLHNSEFGENNQELIDQITGQAPDLILVTGDLQYQTNSVHPWRLKSSIFSSIRSGVTPRCAARHCLQ